jgi:hypothetical protein
LAREIAAAVNIRDVAPLGRSPKGDFEMAIELLRDHDLDGTIQNCVTWNCSCGETRVITFQALKGRERIPCPQCGCVSTIFSGIIDKLENELNG